MYDLAVITVFFNQSSYNAIESNGSVQLVLALSNSSSSDITINILNNNGSAFGECCY